MNNYCTNCGIKLEKNQKYSPNCSVEVIAKKGDIIEEIEYKKNK